jgi:GNAT superfamily N-acetyltransferase
MVMSTWLKSNRKASPLAEHLSNTTYYDEHHKVITHLVDKCGVIVAQVDGTRDEVAGWICAEPNDLFVVHYIYVKPLYRKVGLAKWLMEAAGWKPGTDIVASHITYVQTDGKLTKRYRIENNPYLAWRS